MEKTKLNRFISKYYLNGIAESVIWNCLDDTLVTKVTDDAKSIVGEITCEKSGFPDAKFGINQTSKLRSVLNALGETIDVNVIAENDVSSAMKISDSKPLEAVPLINIAVPLKNFYKQTPREVALSQKLA